MKKSLLALALAAALPTVAQAQSSVTMYGILDASIEQANSNVNALNTTTGGAISNADGSLKMNSGTQSGSRFGVRGVEDLGGGLKAVFTIEHRLNVDTGDTAGGAGLTGQQKFWNGQAWVGLESGMGTLTMGRQYTPLFWAFIPADFSSYGFYNNWAGFNGSPGNITPQGPIRLDNSISYKSPTFGGATVWATYALGETIIDGADSNDILGIAANFRLGGLLLSGGVHSIDTTAVGGLETVSMVGASYNFGKFGLSLAVAQLEFVGGAELANTLVSAYADLAGGKVFANVTNVDASGFVGRRNDAGMQIGLTYSRPLSKRTNWYVSYGMNDFSGIQATTATTLVDNATRLAVGVRHLF